MERKRRKVLKDLVGTFSGPISQTYISSVLPQTISLWLLYVFVPGCAATLNYVHGAGRHLAVLHYELPQESIDSDNTDGPQQNLTIAAAFDYQIKLTKDASPTEYLNGLRNLMITAAFVYQIRKTKDAGITAYQSG